MDSALVHNAVLSALVLLPYPIGYITRKIPQPFLRRVFLFTLGIGFCYLLYGTSFYIVVCGCVFAWAIMHLPGTLCLSGISIPIIGIFWIHWKRLGNVGDWKSDLSGLIMFSAVRVWTTIMNVYDNQRNPKRDYWKNFKISPPPLVKFLVYIFSPIGLISGPILPYSAFEEIINQQSSDEEIKKDLKDGVNTYIYALIAMVIYGSSLILFPTNLIISPEFAAKPYIIRFIISVLYSAFHTSRYVFAWLGAEAGLRSIGSMNLPNLDPNHCRSFRPESFFTIRHAGGLVNEWNHSIHIFLKENIHCRVLALGGPNIVARILTFAFSAFWHGFYPGYYMYAVIVMVFGALDGIRYKVTKPVFTRLLGEKGCFIFDCIHTQCMNYFNGTTWDLLWLEPCIRFHKIMKFIPILYEILLIVVCSLIPKKHETKKEE